MIRVLLVAPSLEMVGGQSVVAARLFERLSRYGALNVALLPINPAFPPGLRWIRRIRYLRTVINSAFYGLSLLRHIPRADVVQAFSASYASFLLAPLPAMMVGRAMGRGIILNYHSGEADDHLTRWRSLLRRALRLPHAIVVPSRYLVDVFARHGYHAISIANFIDPARLPFRSRPQPRPLFLSNRNLESLYDVGTTIRAFGLVQAELPEARLVLAGDGGERASLEALATSLGLQNVSFLGRVTQEEMPRLYDEADVYLNSPLIDNMPSSVIEAFAAGLPVVSTAAGGIPYIAEHLRTALLVPPGDAGAMAACALQVVCEPGLAERLTTEARRECLEHYTWEAVAPQWLALYADIDRARGRRGAVHATRAVDGGAPRD
jgi:L-malate glycosyltransferase